MSRNRIQKLLCIAVLAMVPSVVLAIEPSLPEPYLYTVGQLYTDFVAKERAQQLADQVKGMTVSPGADRSRLAWAYVAGVTDALNDKLFCVPPGTDIGSVVKLYLEGHTGLWDRPASYAVEQALIEKFPCESMPDRPSHVAFLLKYDRH